LHPTEQLAPEARDDEHEPKSPLTGALTEQALGAQDCTVAEPAKQVVAEPTMEYPELQNSWHWTPDAIDDEQEPMLANEGTAMSQGLGMQFWADSDPAKQEVVAKLRL